MMECKDCKYGDINFWGYEECWKYNQKIDTDTTKQAADRERQALSLHKNGDCKEFESKRKWYKFWIRSK